MSGKRARLDSRYWDKVAGSVAGYYLPQVLAEYKSRQYLDLIERWGMPGKGSILITDLYEAAFGDTALFKELDRANSLWTMDISPAVCRTGRERLRSAGLHARVVCCDSRALPFKQDHFDLIVSPSTFDHFPEVETALRECRRTLRPEGRLLLALNSASNPMFRLGVSLAEAFKKKEYETGFFYSAGRTRELIRAAGLGYGRLTGLMHVPLGLTTLVQLLDRWPSGRKLSEKITRLLRLADRTPDGIKLLTGWWVACEGVK